ncbi:MAG: hypothetical protein Q7S30_03990 [Candidatus Omnitrophota bacterium]|nr:hypothetical protein [Candidatus Omnitrophota bacterium]
MIEINLLPEEAKKKKRPSANIDVSAITMPSLPVISIAAWATGAVLSIQMILFVMGVMSGATHKSLELEYKDMLPKKQETEKLRTQVEKMNRKVKVIDELMVKRFSWEKKLNSLSDCMTPGIWLTKLQYDEKITEVIDAAGAESAKKKGAQAAQKNIVSRYLILSGAASSMGEEGTALIGRFIKSLKDDPVFYSDFSDIELGTIKREKLDDQEIMTFNITCFFKAR